MSNFLRQTHVRIGLVFASVLAGCGGASGPISITLTPSATAIDQGAGLAISIKASVTNDTSNKGVKWMLSGPGNITSSTGSSIAYYPPATTISAPQQVTVTATSAAQPTQSTSVQITVNPYPAISISQTLADGIIGLPYSQPIVLTGGTSPFQWSIYNGPIGTGYAVGGSVPAGLTLNPATGVISGTPTAAGTSYFEAVLTDADNVTLYDGLLTLEIDPGANAKGNPIPLLNQSLTPTAVAPGSATLTLKASGTGFVTGATIDLNGTALTTVYVDSQHLTAQLPAADIATAQTISITVVNPSPGGGPSNVVFLPVGASATNVKFANAPNSPLQIPEPLSLVIADFNQDGKPDFAVGAATRVFTMLSNGNGTFTAAPGSPHYISSPPYNDFGSPYIGPLAVGDFTHSNHPGVAVGLAENGAAMILVGDGTGNLTESSSFANTQGEETVSLTAADFNADGNLDLAFTNSPGNSAVALGFGGGAFNPAGIFSTNSSYFGSGIAVGDFNGDGKLDAIMANGGTAYYPQAGVGVWLGNGDGTFQQATNSPLMFGKDLSAVVAADFNGDGKLDIALTDQIANTVSILLGNGDGTFQPPVTFAVGSQPIAIIAGDFNNDGKLDLVTANYGDGTVTLLLGKGDGTFLPAAASPYVVGKGTFGLAAADFNGDGKLDLAIANGLDGTGTVSILLQQ